MINKDNGFPEFKENILDLTGKIHGGIDGRYREPPNIDLEFCCGRDTTRQFQRVSDGEFIEISDWDDYSC